MHAKQFSFCCMLPRAFVAVSFALLASVNSVFFFIVFHERKVFECGTTTMQKTDCILFFFFFTSIDSISSSTHYNWVTDDLPKSSFHNQLNNLLPETVYINFVFCTFILFIFASQWIDAKGDSFCHIQWNMKETKK